MADYEATGEELEKLVRLGKKRPMPFAFCPSNGTDESLFATHRKKPPEIIAKSARKASGQTKVAFGTFTVEAKLMTLVLIKELPSIAKKLKKHLRRERLSLNVKIVDIMGNELEADIEALPEETVLDVEADDDDDAEAEAQAEREAQEALDEDETEEDEDLPDAAKLAKQLKTLQPGIAALQGDAGDTLRTALAGAVGLLKAGSLIRAEATINAIERAYERQPKTEQAQPPAAPPPPSPEALGLAQRLTKLRGIVERQQSPAKEKLSAALGLVAQQIAAGDLSRADQSLGALQNALTEMKPSAPVEGQSDDVAKEDFAPNAAPAQDPEAAAKWAGIAAKLEPIALASISAGKGDVDAIRLKFFGMQDAAMAGDHAKALAQVGDLSAMIRTAQSATQTGAEADIPSDVVPFVKSRLIWIETRVQLRSEITKLKSAMDSVLAGVDGMEEAAAETGKLFDYLDNLDERLEKTLETLVVTPDGPSRQKLKDSARAIIAEYRTELDSAFFRDVDGDNGFAPVKVRGPAIAALQQVSTALAA